MHPIGSSQTGVISSALAYLLLLLSLLPPPPNSSLVGIVSVTDACAVIIIVIILIIHIIYSALFIRKALKVLHCWRSPYFSLAMWAHEMTPET